MQNIKRAKNFRTWKTYRFVQGIVFLYIFLVACALPINTHAASEVQTSGAGLTSKVAPGEFLPLSVKLLNFGNASKVDVTITYSITDLAGKSIYSSAETVAVQSTASFVKTIQIPFDTAPGQYIAKSSLIYQDQLTPATTEFPFSVERKIYGLYQSEFYLYGGITLTFGIIMLAVGYALIKSRRKVRFTTLDYSNISHNDRSYYEILSDTIMQMRMRVGDDALAIASHVDGLTIDEKTGRVLAFTGPPSKIISNLVYEYETLLGKKVSFSFRQNEPAKKDFIN